MPRTNIELPLNNTNIDYVFSTVDSIMKNNGYYEKMVNNEKVWVKGDGVILKMECFKLYFKEKSFVIEAWLKDAMTGESDLSGNFVARVPKNKMKNILTQISEKFPSASVSASIWICDRCGADNNSNALYCSKCGNKRSLSNSYFDTAPSVDVLVIMSGSVLNVAVFIKTTLVLVGVENANLYKGEL